MQMFYSNQMKIEVIICTYNGAKFLTEQLKSILIQTCQPNVISVYDDKSFDDSILLIESFRISFESIGIEYRVEINSENLGYSKNFSQAVSKSKCEYIYFCDQDDIWEPTKIATIHHHFQNTGFDMIFSDGLVVDATGINSMRQSVLESYGLPWGKIGSFNKKPIQYLMRRNYVNGCAAAIRSNAAYQAGSPPSEMPHDYWFALWSALNGGVLCLSDKLYKYRQHDNNVIGIGGNNFIYQMLAILRSPHTPRQRELIILKSSVDRLASVANPEVNILSEKLNWLNRVVNEPRRILRLSNIFYTLIQGEYSRFGQPYSLSRDIISCLKF
jgi:glycosyltransferase involved in cell wall biosynthesis